MPNITKQKYKTSLEFVWCLKMSWCASWNHKIHFLCSVILRWLFAILCWFVLSVYCISHHHHHLHHFPCFAFSFAKLWFFFCSSSPYLSVWCVLCTFISAHFHLLWFHFFLDSLFLFELLLSSILRDSLTHNHIFKNLLLLMHTAGSMDICELRHCGNSQE